jgi:4-diphosphocytidyl-2-C-methyl-D-erythritol kinase
MSVLRARAPGKVNLALYLGPIRPEDGKHELVSLVEPVTLADWLELGPARGAADEVACAGVDGPNLAADALRRFRAASGWDGSPVRLTIFKQVPVAAGMGGGSADAAAALRLAAKASRMAVPDGIAAQLGADVPAALHAGPAIMAGAGERLTPVEPLPSHAFVLLPTDAPLSTAAVYAEADRLGLPRPASDLAERRAELERALAAGELPLLNDLEPAARALHPEVAGALADARAAGATHALVCGSGPTVAGVFATLDAAKLAAEALRERHPRATAAAPAPPGFAAARSFA